MKKKLLLLFCIVNYFESYSQISFQDHIIIDNTHSTDGANSVYAFDIDGDGDLDVISTSFDDNKVAWYENINGQGTFGVQQIITSNTDGPMSIYVTDIDGDGDIDVLSASFDDNKIAWYENIDGQGDFGKQQIISTEANWANYVYSADVDGDGDMDVLSSSLGDNKIAWYENTNGLGVFGSQQIITTDMANPILVYASDIDGDGDMDVISTSSFNGKIAWHENIDGKGSYGVPKIISTNYAMSISICTIDLDGDGDLDLLSNSSSKGNVVWHKNIDGQGSFSTPIIISKDNYSSSSVSAADFDGDGDMDVLSNSSAYSVGKGTVVWFENINGQGYFNGEEIIVSNIADVNTVYSADMDGDGNMDVLTSSHIEDEISWYKNTNGTGSFDEEKPINVSVVRATSVYTADIDGDGDMDVLSASYSDNKISLFENTDGKGTFSNQQIITTSAVGARKVYATDIDNDGDMDVLSASDEKIVLYENTNEFGIFGKQKIITSNTHTKDVYTADMDGDGDMDVLSAYFGRVAWEENIDGKGNFISRQISGYKFGGLSVFANDLDGDGDMDVILGNNDGIIWFENLDGQGNFGEDFNSIWRGANDYRSVYSADIDGDGDMDVLSGSFYDDTIAWYENIDGQGDFGTQQIISTEANWANSVYASDIDGDGDMDILSASSNDNKIAWYENTNGQGDFGDQQIITTNAIGANSVYASDIDGDGDIDILSASSFDNKIAWYENTNVILSLNEFSSLDFSIYPIPTSDFLNIKLKNHSIEKVILFDLTGKQLIESNRNEINLTNFKRGIYLIKIYTTSNSVINSKIIKK